MRRFPALAKMFSLETESDIPASLPEHLKAPIEILESKQGLPTAKDSGKLLHSLYNPVREAEQAALSAHASVPDCSGCVFFSCGLGYSALSYAQKFPNDTLIIVENDPRYFFNALSLVDWTPIFSHRNCIIALGTGIDSVVSLIERTSGLKHTVISENQAQSFHSKDYFAALRSLIERNKRKVEINESTLEKFSKLWLKNTCKNLHFLSELDGINIFKDSFPSDLPVVILAAGPTLEEILPSLKKIKERSILIAVDTALRACLKSGVEPDFVVLTDPQYYAWRHIAGLSSPSSILITESAAYPAVFRFDCKKILLCASLFPLGSYVESKIGGKGSLVAGGSVSTTAWEAARFFGAKKIYFSGLDLGYPGFQTHIKGSTFEEAVHTSSNRLRPAEKSGVASLFGANMISDSDYAGGKILTDSKMKMFAWWFESKAEEFKDSIQTYSLSEKSIRIPNFKVTTIEEILETPEKSSEKKEFFEKADEKSVFPFGERLLHSVRNDGAAVANRHCDEQSDEAIFLKEKFNSALEDLNSGLAELYSSAKKGIKIAENGILSPSPEKFLPELEKIDSKILHSEYKEIASLVFPNEKKLASLFENIASVTNPVKSSFQKSKIIYQELIKSISQYQTFLPKNS